MCNEITNTVYNESIRGCICENGMYFNVVDNTCKYEPINFDGENNIILLKTHGQYLVNEKICTEIGYVVTSDGKQCVSKSECAKYW